MRVALDTNILAYAEGVGDKRRCNAAMRLVEQLPSSEVVLPAQTLGELFRVLTGKDKRSTEQTREAVLSWLTAQRWPTPLGLLFSRRLT